MTQFGGLGLEVPGGQPPPDIVSKKGLAQVLGVHPSRVTQLLGRGLPTEPNGRVSVTKARAWISANLDPHKTKMLQANGQAPAKANGVRQELDGVRVERARLELDRARGSLVDRKTVESAIFARARAERDAHMAWVVRVAPVLATRLGADANAIYALLDAEMRQHLADLAARSLTDLA